LEDMIEHKIRVENGKKGRNQLPQVAEEGQKDDRCMRSKVKGRGS